MEPTDMMPYLVSGTVVIKQYMSETDRRICEQRIVMASCPEEATEKFERYWESKTDEYSVYYRVAHVTVFDTIR